jgi:hypothetical protein
MPIVHAEVVNQMTDQKPPGKLFFLAKKSQEQVTDEYRLLSAEIYDLAQRTACIVNKARV